MLPGQDYTAADIGTCKEVTVLKCWLVSTYRHSQPWDSAPAPADWVQSGRNATDLAPILPNWPDSVPYVKIGHQQSTAIQLEVSIPQGSVLGVDLSCSHTKWLSHYYASCTGCRFNIKSPTSWRHWHTRSRPNRCQRIWVDTPSYVTPWHGGLYARPRLIDFLNNSPVQHLLTVQCAIPCFGPATCNWQQLTRNI